MALRLASRRSPLAQRQARYVQDRLRANGIESELIWFDTTGDRRVDASLTSIGGAGVFAVEIQRCVLDGEADVAVHSAKDLPAFTPEGLSLSCVPQRLDCADVLVGRSLAGLGPGATVATGSPRRRALLLERRPDLNVVELRGNMATRLGAVGERGIDAVVAAAAALERLDLLERVSERLDPTWFVPQVGQGALALEIRSGDEATATLLKSINDDGAQRALNAERAFLRELGAGCSIPLGAVAHVEGNLITLSAVMAAVDGTASVRASDQSRDPVALGTSLARHLRDERGGGDLPGWRP
jgi:hydroxymethylbilane synthase